MLRTGLAILWVCLISGGCGGTSVDNGGGTKPSDGFSTSVAPDNSAVNQRDRESNAKTPFDQSNAQSDLDITAKIRQRVVDLPDLSLNARNVKIITADGKVTLRGPVDSADERSAIEKIAHDVAGHDKVENLLDVVAK